MVKLSDATWADAIGNAVIDTGRLLDSGALADSVETTIQPWELFEREIPASGAIVEEFLPGSVSSPSGQGYIDESGAVSVTSSHEQIVVSGQYSGCTFPARGEFVPKINDAVRSVGTVLSASGLRGTFGLDFVGFDGGDLYAVEINCRKVAPSHVVAHVEAAVGSTVGQEGQLVVDGHTLYYAHLRFYSADLRNLGPLEAVSALRERGMLYSRTARKGVLLHILSAIRPCGYVEVTCLDGHPEGATALLKDAETELLRRSLDVSMV